MTIGLVVLIVGAIALPHALPLGRVPAGAAIAVWLAVLILRATTTLLATALFMHYLPASGRVASLTGWCWPAVLPLFAAHLGFSGRSAGEAAVLVPALVVAGSMVSATLALLQAARAVRGLLRVHAIGVGPMRSVIIGGPTVTVAAAGLVRPQVVVSAGALALLDDAELAVSLEHERGHIERRHRFILLCGQICCAIGCFLPGGRSALRELAFHTERDADAFALRTTHEPLALVSAICKSANGWPPLRAGLRSPKHRSASRRLNFLAAGPASLSGGRPSRAVGAGVVAALLLSLAAILPPVAAGGVARQSHTNHSLNCPS